MFLKYITINKKLFIQISISVFFIVSLILSMCKLSPNQESQSVESMNLTRWFKFVNFTTWTKYYKNSPLVQLTMLPVSLRQKKQVNCFNLYDFTFNHHVNESQTLELKDVCYVDF